MPKVLHHAVQWMKKNKICNCIMHWKSKQDQTSFWKLLKLVILYRLKLIFKHDNLTRQITESVYIFRTEQQKEFELMNTKSEWNAPTLYTVRREIGHGWGYIGVKTIDIFQKRWYERVRMTVYKFLYFLLLISKGSLPK